MATSTSPQAASSPNTPNDSSNLHWLALALTPGLSAVGARRVVEHFGDVGSVFRASLTELEAARVKAETAQSIALGKSLELAREEVTKAGDLGALLVALDHPLYPARLREIYDPPLALYVRGNAEALSRPSIAMVGTRHPTPYGLGMAERLACDLVARGIIILSGLARGVDSASHRGAIAGKGATIAVLGTGIDIIYPRENQKLVDPILAGGGALVSEFPVGTHPAPQNFPIRNRIISGMSLGVLVVEAGENSGTRITARCALEQNRELFAVPGNVTNRNAWGPNTLIKQGAKLVATWEDVWEELPANVRLALEQEGPPATDATPEASLFAGQGLSEHEKKVFQLIRADESIHIDRMVEQLEGKMSTSEIFAALFELELRSKIRQLPGKNFVRTF